ncbi:MAG: DUF4330 domain-containing protein [Clostridia bacterium]|nr:DUF4330 domain-containing protein [Clostridia bacterium]
MKNNAQKPNRFNIIDFMLIVTVLACLIGIAMRTNIKETVIESNDTATVTVMVRGLLNDNVKYIAVGDEYFNQNSGQSIGVLQSVESSAAKIRTPRYDGTIAVTDSVDRSDVICKVKVKGLSTSDGFLIDGTAFIGSGSKFSVRSVNLQTEWLVVDIEVDKK